MVITKDHKYKHISNLVIKPEDNRSLIMKIAELPKEERLEILEKIAAASYPNLGLKGIRYDWSLNGRPDQLIPLNLENNWNIFALNCGRGTGKTRTAAEWVRHMAQVHPGCRIALVGATTSDIHKTMLSGDSGILTITPEWEGVRHIPTYQRLEWKNGTVAEAFSAEKPDRLRGPQYHYAWLDEITSWKNAEDTFNMLSFGLRLGNDNRILISTTPKNQEFYKRLLGMDNTWTLVASTFDNKANLSEKFIKDMVSRYEGTRLGSQELEADVLDDVEGALWKQSWIDKNRVLLKDIDKLPEFLYVVMAIDPAMTAKKNSDETGICVAAYGVDDKYYILHADSYKESAHEWAKIALRLYNDYWVQSIVVETNQGGDLVLENLRRLRPDIAVSGIHAKKGKILRAEPVAHEYERGRIKHVGVHARAEAQMTEFNPILNSSGKDDICLIGETVITTSDGLAFIKNINQNHMVLTRNGYKKVLQSSITGLDRLVYSVLVSDGTILVGTENHPLFIQNKGFTKIKDIADGDLIYKCQEKTSRELKQLSLMALLTEDTQIQKVQVLEDTSTQAEASLNKDLEDYIEKFGSLFMEKFQKDMSSTTKIETILTTIFQILSVFHKKSTLRNIKKKYAKDPINQNILITSIALEDWLQRGIGQMKEEHGTKNMQKIITLEKLKILNAFVSNVIQNSVLSENQLNFVLENVDKNTIEIQASTLLKSNVNFAKLLSLIITHMEKNNKDIAPLNVLGKLELRKDTVYNLKVEDESEYFANGILTHNCDALTYACLALMEKAMVSAVYSPAVGGLRHKLLNYRAR